MRSFMVSLFIFAVLGCGAPAGTGDLTAPIADPGDDRVIAVGESTTLSGLLSCDPSEGGLNYSWSVLEKPDNSTVAPDTNALKSVQFGITADVAGTYIFELVVTNGSRSSVPEVVVVEASADENRLTSVSSEPATEDRCGNPL